MNKTTKHPARTLGALLPALSVLPLVGGRGAPEPLAQLPAAHALAPPSTTDTTPRVMLAFVGDILMAASVGAEIARHGVDFPWDRSRELLQSADIAIGNLVTAEAPYIVERNGIRLVFLSFRRV